MPDPIPTPSLNVPHEGTLQMSETTSPTSLLELSFADAIRLIQEASGLPDTVRQQWACALRRIADGLDRPLAGC
jgi:hypothetical protein